MKISVLGKNSSVVKEELRRRGIPVISSPVKADLLIAYGGDGTMLGAERDYPGILKYPVRDAETAPLCPKHSLLKQLDAFEKEKLKTIHLRKLECVLKDTKLHAVNDIFAHNLDNAGALRFKVWIDGKLYSHEIVGDGVGVATVHGSTAYYKSITHSMFRVGIGLAFSNATEFVGHMVLREDSVVKLRINRGPAEVVADNDPKPPRMATGDECSIFLSEEGTDFLGLDIFMCPECRRRRLQYRYSIFEPGEYPG